MTSDRGAERPSIRSRRLPDDFAPNDLSLRVAEAIRLGRPPIDLTEGNPTRVGLSDLDEPIRAALAPECGPRGRRSPPT
jgi:hypothetical protein